jgi:TPR repeat protein
MVQFMRPLTAALALVLTGAPAGAQNNGPQNNSAQNSAATQASQAQAPQNPWLTTDPQKMAAIQQAVAVAQQRANAGDAVAQKFLGTAYRFGNGVAKDPAQSFFWMKKAADGGIMRAKSLVGLYYRTGFGVQADPAQAFRYAKAAADELDPAGLGELGYDYEKGIGTAVNPQEAFNSMLAAVLMGDAFGAFKVSKYSETGFGTDKDPETAAFFRAVAQQRGFREQAPNGAALPVAAVTQDNVQDLLDYIKTAKKNDDGVPFVQELLGQIFIAGNGIPRDVPRGMALLEQAANAGLPTARRAVGFYYMNGNIVPRDNAKALKYFQMGAEQQDAGCLQGVGLYYQYGGGVSPVDPVKARQYYDQAIKRQWAKAAFQLGLLYQDGLGVPADRATANYWFATALQQGYRPAEAYLHVDAPATRSLGGQTTAQSSGGNALPLAAAAAPAGPRLALVIGNSNYTGGLPGLANPTKDADLIAKKLQQSGFQVTALNNLTQIAMKKAVQDFGQRLAAAGPQATAFFYYAGHGVQSNGTNYLVPVDAVIKTEADIDLYAVSANTLMRQIEGSKAMTNIIVLDACRNAPYQRGSRDFDTGGLAPMNVRNGTFIAYSTAPGETAADGTGANSPFAAALANAMVQPGLEVEQVFKSVRRQVMQQTGGAQTPWDASSLVASFSFQK